MLKTAFGPVVNQCMEDSSVVEIMLNPDGRLWVDRLGHGREDTGHSLYAKDAERVIFLVASSVGAQCSRDNPLLSAELPGCGSRFQGVLPPLVQNPVFTIRKKASMVFPLEDYVTQGIMTQRQRALILEAVENRKNILIAGGTGSGKTTLANAVLSEVARCGDRVVILEDTCELQCMAEDVVYLRTRDEVAGLNDLLKATLRLRPDRIVVGEVRGAEALTLLKSWNTGHPGGLCTIHANSARQALTRLEQLVQEAAVYVPRSLIADAVDMVVFIERTGQGRQVSDVSQVTGIEADAYLMEHLFHDKM
jgi:type IV secretion system protein VirB11